jgi:hypothetical protein
MKGSATIGNLMLALAAAQGEMANPEKSLTNPHFKSKYADITGGIEAVRGPLSKHKIAFIQTTRMEGDVLVLETTLAHAESGEWISSEAPVIRLPARPQEVGSALTYFRRYSLFSICGISGDTPDDDANIVNESANSATPAPRKRIEPPKVPKLTEEDSMITLRKLLEDVEHAQTREDLKELLTLSTDARSGMWDDDKELFKHAFRSAEDRIFAATIKEGNGQ